MESVRRMWCFTGVSSMVTNSMINTLEMTKIRIMTRENRRIFSEQISERNCLVKSNVSTFDGINHANGMAESLESH